MELIANLKIACKINKSVIRTEIELQDVVLRSNQLKFGVSYTGLSIGDILILGYNMWKSQEKNKFDDCFDIGWCPWWNKSFS